MLLTVLWVRSYWVYEGIVYESRRPSESTVLMLTSNHGTLAFGRLRIPARDVLAGSVDGWDYQNWGSSYTPVQKFIWGNTYQDFVAQFPTWLPAIIFYALATAPWMGDRFSLRTLLIAFTLTALTLLAIVMYTAR